MMTHMTYVGDGNGGNGQKILVMANMMVMAYAQSQASKCRWLNKGGDGGDSHEDGDDCD